MKVYIVTQGSYSSYRVQAAFSSEALAQRYLESRLVDEGGIEEMELDELEPQAREGYGIWHCRLQRNGNVDGAVELDDQVRRPDFYTPHMAFFALLRVSVWARDAEHAVKIANEKRSQIIASGVEWGDEPGLMKWLMETGQ